MSEDIEKSGSTESGTKGTRFTNKSGGCNSECSPVKRVHCSQTEDQNEVTEGSLQRSAKKTRKANWRNGCEHQGVRRFELGQVCVNCRLRCRRWGVHYCEKGKLLKAQEHEPRYEHKIGRKLTL